MRLFPDYNFIVTWLIEGKSMEFFSRYFEPKKVGNSILLLIKQKKNHFLKFELWVVFFNMVFNRFILISMVHLYAGELMVANLFLFV